MILCLACDRPAKVVYKIKNESSHVLILSYKLESLDTINTLHLAPNTIGILPYFTTLGGEYDLGADIIIRYFSSFELKVNNDKVCIRKNPSDRKSWRYINSKSKGFEENLLFNNYEFVVKEEDIKNCSDK